MVAERASLRDAQYRTTSEKLVPARRAVGCETTMSRFTRLFERVLPLTILAMAIIGAPVMILSPQGLPRLKGLQKELHDVDEENAELRREIDALRGRVTRLRDDPRAVEQIARDKLGLVRKSEVVFQFQARR